MKIPVFISCPTQLNTEQESARKYIIRELGRLGMEPRSLGRSDYPVETPFTEVLVVAKHCSGGIILGFKQIIADSGKLKPGTSEESIFTKPLAFPTPWNQLEAGILFALGIPLLVFKEEDINGGVFGRGATAVFIHKMPIGLISRENKKALREMLLNWQRKVRVHYYTK